MADLLEALNNLCASIPPWEDKVNELNDQIAFRQTELKNNGITEPLRPKDGDENSFKTHDGEAKVDRINSTESRRLQQNGFSTTARAAPPQSSEPTQPTQPRLGPAILQKRKTYSLASGESQT